MAKRKRLTPARPGFLDGTRAPETKAMPMAGPAPIAQVAGEASALAALTELSDAVEGARAAGLMIEALPLDVIDERHLVRDRLVQDEDEMEALVASIRARGQQTPVEVLELPEPLGGRTHGLISGWRRLTALRQLHAETGDPRFATIRALVVAPDTAQDAYVAMVEENEIRVNLSLYERARIALRTVREGVYPTTRAALQGLYGSTTRSKRSKIGSFIALVEALDDTLHHPAAISEKLGLALVKRLADTPGALAPLKAALRARPDRSAAEEMRILGAAPPAPPKPAPPARPRLTMLGETPSRRGEIAPGIHLGFDPKEGRIELAGPQVDAALHAALKDWLRRR